MLSPINLIKKPKYTTTTKQLSTLVIGLKINKCSHLKKEEKGMIETKNVFSEPRATEHVGNLK